MVQLDPDDPLSPLGISFPPLPPLPPLPPSRPVWPPPPPSSSEGGIILVLVIGFAAMLVVFACVGHRNSRARDAAAAAAPAETARVGGRARELRGACTHAANTPPPTARLPAFTYSRRSAKRNVAGGGEESCSVCLAAFRLGETVRLLPVCLHLYHAECIDPWLDAHSTCPLCRSDADPSTDLSRLPPV